MGCSVASKVAVPQEQGSRPLPEKELRVDASEDVYVNILDWICGHFKDVGILDDVNVYIIQTPCVIGKYPVAAWKKDTPLKKVQRIDDMTAFEAA
eukprot:TRINITY_DN2997_c1_g3_i1.p2 TRINITY_DN2997_c1_g3~~TRINITY_DN2997_c1_g3_i1.p2  ORF type:complete len:105 (-),score=23.45 TRINITY_DN2997_c1_g3_i1:93-377(-)